MKSTTSPPSGGRGMFFAEATAWWNLGYVPLPVAPDGSKRPAGRWKHWQTRRPTMDELARLFCVDHDGLGVLTGATSGNLEMFELEGRAVTAGVLDRLAQAMTDHGQDDLWKTIAGGYAERTPSGGIHYYYRVGDGPAAPSTHLALTAEHAVLIETRGEGAFSVVAPSNGRTHPTGNAWTVLVGAPETVPTITAVQRDALHGVASTLDELDTPPVQQATTGRPDSFSFGSGTGGRPGDDFEQRATWAEILEPHGWTRVPEGWRRPGKTDPGISATENFEGRDKLHVFTTSTVLTAGEDHSKFHAYAQLNHGGDMHAAARALAAAGYGTAPAVTTAQAPAVTGPVEDEEESGKEPRQSAATMLVELALERYRFGVTSDGQPFGIRPGRHVVRMLRGGQGSLRAELSQDYYRLHGKAAPQQALADALLVLEGMAQQQNPEEVHIRVAAGTAGTVWLDLGDAAETAVRVDASGWQTVDSGVPVLFRRTALTGVLPAPAVGSVDRLWHHLNVSEVDRPLVLAWLVAALADPNNPHPILDLNGEQGTGKSTASRRLVSLVDPSPVPLRKPPRDQDAWVTAAQGSWVVGLDNLSTVPDWLSDSLCRASTGDGDVRRALYTDGGLAVFAFRRCVLVNGIDLGALRGDLADRIVLVQLDLITESARVTESELATQWDGDYPSILGGLLTLCAGVIARSPSLRLERSPRMADFAKVVAALDEIRGTGGLARLGEQAKVMAEDSLLSEPLLQALDEQRPDFVGTAAQLLDTLTPADDRWRAPKGWPRSPRAVTTVLKRNAPSLRKAGWTIYEAPNRKETTEWTVRPEIARNGHRQDRQDRQDGPYPAPNRGSGPKQGAGQVPVLPVMPVIRQADNRHPEQAPIPLIEPISTPGAGYAGLAGVHYGQSQDDGPGATVSNLRCCTVCGQRLLFPASKDAGVCAACSKRATA